MAELACAAMWTDGRGFGAYLLDGQGAVWACEHGHELGSAALGCAGEAKGEHEERTAALQARLAEDGAALREEAAELDTDGFIRRTLGCLGLDPDAT